MPITIHIMILIGLFSSISLLSYANSYTENAREHRILGVMIGAISLIICYNQVGLLYGIPTGLAYFCLSAIMAIFATNYWKQHSRLISYTSLVVSAACFITSNLAGMA